MAKDISENKEYILFKNENITLAEQHLVGEETHFVLRTDDSSASVSLNEEDFQDMLLYNYHHEVDTSKENYNHE